MAKANTNEYLYAHQSHEGTRQLLYMGCCWRIPDCLCRLCTHVLPEDSVRHSCASLASASSRTDFYTLVRVVFHPGTPGCPASRRSASPTGYFWSGAGPTCRLRGYGGCVSC